jgi:membrane-bound lytic murein transglycosylase B
MRFILSFIISSIVLFSHDAYAQMQSFESFIHNFKNEARSKGISQPVIDKAFYNIQPIPKVIELDRKQPESTMTFSKYRARIVSPERVQKGREMMRTHAQALAKVEERYGVPREYIVALWGIETNFGSNTGGYDLIPALATLAWDGRRSEFFKTELMNALKILDQDHITQDRFKGSWAGAMGQNQFMPSSFHKFAVDGNGDGRKNIWTDLDDVFASSANYLKTVGWKPGERWGRAVNLSPAAQKIANSEQGTGLNTRKRASLKEWRDMGVTLSNGQSIPVVEGMMARIVQPDGAGTQAFLVYDNYAAIMHWNKSVYFASSVGLLADAISQ